MAKKLTTHKPGDPGPISITLPLGSQSAYDFATLEKLMVGRMGYHRPTHVQVAAVAFRISALLIEREPTDLLELLWDMTPGEPE